MGKNTWACSFSLPRDLAGNISVIAKRLGISQSALLAELMSQPIADLRRLVDQIPAHPSQGDVLRLRGASIEVVQQRVREAMAEISDA